VQTSFADDGHNIFPSLYRLSVRFCGAGLFDRLYNKVMILV
jgi:hypothetical protein